MEYCERHFREYYETGNLIEHSPENPGEENPAPCAGGKAEEEIDSLRATVLGGPPVKSSSQDPLVNTQIGNFRIIFLLGHGGCGKVYKAQDIVLGREVAVKFLLTSFDPVQKRLFEREARALAKLSKHHSIVEIYQWGEHDGQNYFILEYVESNVHELISENSRGLPVQKALDITLQCAEALSEAHRFGIVHRDIKPANILLESNGTQVKVADFGLAGLHDQSEFTITGNIIGSPPFMSPEQATAQQVDARSDVFSLGATLYFMLSGHAPYLGGKTAEVIRKASHAEFEPLSTYRPNLPKRLYDLVSKAMAADPSERFQSSRQFAREIRVLLQSLEDNGAIPEPIAPAKPLGIKKAYFAALMIVVLISVSGICGYLYLNNDSATRDDPSANSEEVIGSQTSSTGDDDISIAVLPVRDNNSDETLGANNPITTEEEASSQTEKIEGDESLISEDGMNSFTDSFDEFERKIELSKVQGYEFIADSRSIQSPDFGLFLRNSPSKESSGNHQDVAFEFRIAGIEKQEYLFGEKIQFSITTRNGGHVLLFCTDSKGEVSLLHPSAFQLESYMAPGESAIFPVPNESGAGALQAGPPAGPVLFEIFVSDTRPDLDWGKLDRISKPYMTLASGFSVDTFLRLNNIRPIEVGEITVKVVEDKGVVDVD